jgi:hypothetical protein
MSQKEARYALPVETPGLRVGGRLLEPILTQTAHFLVPLQRLKSLNHHPQWRVGNFGENYHAEKFTTLVVVKKPCALTTRRSVGSRRLAAGRCNEQLSTKCGPHRVRLGGHSPRCNLGLFRNTLVIWSPLNKCSLLDASSRRLPNEIMQALAERRSRTSRAWSSRGEFWSANRGQIRLDRENRRRIFTGWIKSCPQS